MEKLRRFLIIIGPGMLTAATGVGAGDLATGSFAGSLLGTAILWAVIVGALLKYTVTEGIARWQLATGTTLLEGLTIHFGRGAAWLFLPYLLLFTYFIGTAMMSACGVTLHAMIPLFDDAADGKIFFGILSSIVGLALVYRGGYQLFEKTMRICIGAMFVTVMITAALLWPGTDIVLRGIFIPTIPDFHGNGLIWTIALIGGVGGTITVLSYGYWIREEGRAGGGNIPVCRIDLAVGYSMTALFGLAMVIIGSTITIQGDGATLLVNLSKQLGTKLGPAGEWLFLIGAFGTVFSSLLGVWQSIPYIFADTWLLASQSRSHTAARGASFRIGLDTSLYRRYMIAIAFVPMLGLFTSFQEMQKFYAVVGAYFFPFLAMALLLLNCRAKWVGEQYKYGMPAIIGLIATIALFIWAATHNIST
ncbi:MAG: Nramp family divalent metal transporter [Nitrosomonas sp.]|nr:Nramp family divalent metal transporter [Nitrosomonas sp.]MCW5606949.1 Nramp family divalent metal transporter [Nitrosomonas sp.]